MEHETKNFKWRYPSHSMMGKEMWQQWIRLEDSYHDGLYCAYDDPDLNFTNNAKEQLFHHSKAHFKALLGHQNITRAYQTKGGIYVHLIDFDYSDKNISSTLLACETPLVEIDRQIYNALYTVKRRR